LACLSGKCVFGVGVFVSAERDKNGNIRKKKQKKIMETVKTRSKRYSLHLFLTEKKIWNDLRANY